jgi:hypothetical protein
LRSISGASPLSWTSVSTASFFAMVALVIFGAA